MNAPIAEDDHPLRLLAAAVVGHPVSITYLMQPGARSYSDGERIYLPAQDSLEARRLCVIVQGALRCGGALGPKRMQILIGRTELCQRYLTLEVERCCNAIEDRLPASFLERLQAYRTDCDSSGADDSLQIARSRRVLPTPPIWYGTLQPWRILRRAFQSEDQRLTDQKLLQLEARLKAITEDSPEEDESLKRSSFWKYFTSPIGKDTLMSRFLRDLLDMRSSPGREGADDGSGVSSDMVAARASSRVRNIAMAIRSSLDVSLPSAFVRSETGAHSYPEWDHAAQRYRLDWVNVEEVDPHAEESQLAAGTLTGSNLPFQRALAGLCLGFQRHRDQPQGDDLVLDRMVRLAVDLRSGYSGDPRIHAANLRTRRDLGVLILLDASSSTLERSADGARIFDLQAKAAWQLCHAFATLGDRVAMQGFNSWGRTLVRFQTLKGFDEPAGAFLESRLRHMAITGYTRCGGALRHATTQIEAHAGTPYKLLLLISDGYPYDDQYEGEYAIQDTSKAIEEARALGVACVCVSVGSDADSARLTRVYGAGHYLSIRRNEQLIPHLRRLIESALALSVRNSEADSFHHGLRRAA
jgi:nitric oxide reductase activation protein